MSAPRAWACALALLVTFGGPAGVHAQTPETGPLSLLDEFELPDVFHFSGSWTWSWWLQGRGIELSSGFDLGGDVDFDLRVHDRVLANVAARDGGWFVYQANRLFAMQHRLTIEPSGGGCGLARNAVEEHHQFAGARTSVRCRGNRSEDCPHLPRCARHMSASAEVLDGVWYQTCVDRATLGDDPMTQLAMIVSSDRLEWVWAPVWSDQTGPSAVLWPMPASCHPFFARAELYTQATAARRNLALELAWAPDGELVWVQGWKDDRETGVFVAFYPEGRVMTVGYRVEGSPHGLWWYFDTAGDVIEARLYALGVELEQLPVENVRSTYRP